MHGDAGAREIFEKICSELLISIFPEDSHPIRVTQGDGGIDILVGDFFAPIINYQCKCFIDGVDEAQKAQIRNSFHRAITSLTYTMKKWVLCIPCVMSLTEFDWWSNWRNENQQRHKIEIALWDGAFLISELKKYGIYDTAFDNDQKLMLEDIHRELLAQKLRVWDELIVFVRDPSLLGYTDAIFVKKLENARIREIDGCKRDFFNAELSEHALRSKGNDSDIKVFENVKSKVFSLWETQYRQFQDENDGNDLLTRVYSRIEDLDASTLQVPLAEINLFAKRGILHQWAEDCSIGWLSDYKTKLETFLLRGATDHV
jgi:hypothetical protein